MPLIVEDGSGKVDAQTFVEASYVDAYAAARGNPLAWDTKAAEDKDVALVKAADYLRNEMRYQYRGTRKTADQCMPFPRTGVVEAGGLALTDGIIPWRIKDAQAALAIRFAADQDLQPDLDRGGKITSETVDVISVDYADDAPAETLLTEVEGYLRPLLKTASREPVPYQATPTDPAVFEDTAFLSNAVRPD